MNRDLVRMLSGTGVDAALVGGKAAALDRLVALGVQVPAAAAITTRAYLEACAQEPVASLIASIQEASADDVDGAFLAVPLDQATTSAVLELGELLAPAGRTLAVRSSATAEDLSMASFAGQYRTVLRVHAGGELLEAVRLVWASLWHPAPRAYRAYHGISDRDAAMGVIVMQLVEPELAGVAFTVDPETETGRLRVEAVHGLGEQLVSGAVTPEVYVAARADPAAALRSAGPPFPEVAELALEIERRFGEPQDVEWAWDGKQVYIVQTRPITTMASSAAVDDGFDVLPDPAAMYTRAGIGEMLPGVLPPLLWDVNSFAIEEAFRALFDDLSGLPDDLVANRGVVGRIWGRAVLNLDLLKASAAKSPGGSADEIERQYYGEVLGAEADEPARLGRFTHLLANLRVIRAQHRAATQAEMLARAVTQVVATSHGMTQETDAELMGYFQRLVDFGARVVGTEVSVAAAAAGAYRALEILLSRWVPEGEVAVLAQQLTAGTGVRMGLDVAGLVALARSTPEVQSILETEPDWTSARDRMMETEAGRAYLVAADRSMREAGSIAVFGGTAWPERAADAWSSMRGSIDVPGRDAPDAAEALRLLEARLVAKEGWRRTRLLTGQVVDVRIRILRRQVADAAELLALRERAKAAVLELGGELRRCLLALGERLAASGTLEQATDIVYLNRSELEAAFSGGAPPLAEIGRRRRWIASLPVDATLPTRFRGRPALATAPVVAAGDTLTGWAASPGRHRGRARVLASPVGVRLARGDVLVAHATDASWSPLFLRAGGVVVEEGGPLSHAAIVARELGVPAVLNVPGAVARLSGRDVDVTVDGTSGEVHVHDADHRPTPGDEGAGPSKVFDDIDLAQHHVFVPAVLGFGMLFSIFVLMRDVVRNMRSQRGMDRRSTLVAHSVARGVISGQAASASDHTGFRSRRGYAVIAIALFSLAAYLIPGAVWNYLNPVGYVKDVAWLLALSLIGIAFFIFAGVVNAVAVIRWRSLPARLRPFFILTPLTKLDDTVRHDLDTYQE